MAITARCLSRRWYTARSSGGTAPAAGGSRGGAGRPRLPEDRAVPGLPWEADPASRLLPDRLWAAVPGPRWAEAPGPRRLAAAALAAVPVAAALEAPAAASEAAPEAAALAAGPGAGALAEAPAAGASAGAAPEAEASGAVPVAEALADAVNQRSSPARRYAAPDFVWREEILNMLKRAYVEITNICNLHCDFCPGTRREKRCIPPGRGTPLAEYRDRKSVV